MSHERLKNNRIIKSRTEPNRSNRATLLQKVSGLLNEIDHYLNEYPPESDTDRTNDERAKNGGSQGSSSDSVPAASLSCNSENLNVTNTLIPSSSNDHVSALCPIDESGETLDSEDTYDERVGYKQYGVPSNSDTTIFDQIVEDFSRIWTCIRSDKGSDVCYIADKLGNGRLYIINDLGYSLTCVSLSEQQLIIIKRNRAAFQSALCSKYISETEFALLLEWQKSVSRPRATSEVSNEIVWNDIKYKRQNTSYYYRAEAFESSSPIWLIEPCKSYFKNGVCRNDDCLYLHDPTNAVWCKKFFTNIKSSVSQFSLKHSQKRNEYTTPVCELNLNGLCRYPTGVESGEMGENICQYWHGPNTMSTYPTCRRFAHIGFCYRGSFCKFKHLWKCPDNSMGAPCMYENCNFLHPVVPSSSISKKDTKITSLCDIPGTDYMAPPILDEKIINNKESTFHATNLKNDVEQCGPSIKPSPTKSTRESQTTAAQNATTNTRTNPDEEDVLNADFISL